MNLIQIQERLKDMPTQAVMAYANGMNPEIPPYVALSELERRKRMEQMSQPAEMPQGTVKDKIEQQVGLMEVQKQQQQAAMQQMMAGDAQQPRGLPAAPVPPQMFAQGGGIVAFAEGDEVEDQSVDTEVEMADLLRRGKQRLDEKPPAPASPLAQREALIKQYPHLAILNQPIGQEAMEGLQALQAKQAEEDARQRAALQDQRKSEFFKSLIAAGEATRGQKGIGALFGGFGRAMTGAEEQLGKQETEIRGRSLKREADMLALRNEIAKLKRSQAEGDVQGEIKHAQQVAELANKLGISQNALLRGMIGGLASLRGREVAAEATVEAAGKRATGAGAGPRETAQDRRVNELAAEYIEQGMDPVAARAKATREVLTTPRDPAAATVRATTEDMAAAEKDARRAAVQFLGTPQYEAEFKKAYDTALRRRVESRNAQPGAAPRGGSAPPPPPPGFVADKR